MYNICAEGFFFLSLVGKDISCSAVEKLGGGFISSFAHHHHTPFVCTFNYVTYSLLYTQDTGSRSSTSVAIMIDKRSGRRADVRVMRVHELAKIRRNFVSETRQEGNMLKQAKQYAQDANYGMDARNNIRSACRALNLAQQHPTTHECSDGSTHRGTEWVGSDEDSYYEMTSDSSVCSDPSTPRQRRSPSPSFDHERQPEQLTPTFLFPRSAPVPRAPPVPPPPTGWRPQYTPGDGSYVPPPTTFDEFDSPARRVVNQPAPAAANPGGYRNTGTSRASRPG